MSVALTHSMVPTNGTTLDIAEYARWFTQPGRATAGFNLYRTWVSVDEAHWRADRARVLDLPTLWIHGMQDPFVPAAHMAVLPKAFANLRVERSQSVGIGYQKRRPGGRHACSTISYRMWHDRESVPGLTRHRSGQEKLWRVSPAAEFRWADHEGLHFSLELGGSSSNGCE